MAGMPLPSSGFRMPRKASLAFPVTEITNHATSLMGGHKADWDPQQHTGDVFARSLYFKDPNGIVLEFCAWTATFGPVDVVHTPKTAADLRTEQGPVTV